MEMDAAVTTGPLSAEEVLRLRMKEQQEAQREAKLACEEADRLRDEKEQLKREHLRQEITRECALAISRLAEAGYPDGGLMPIVTRYDAVRRWYGRRYYTCHTNERACWPLFFSDWLTTIYLSSDGKLYMDRENPYGYRGKRGTIWRGLHEADLSDDFDSEELAEVLKSLKALPSS